MHILPPVTAEGFDGSHHPRFADSIRAVTDRRNVGGGLKRHLNKTILESHTRLEGSLLVMYRVYYNNSNAGPGSQALTSGTMLVNNSLLLPLGT